MKRLVCTLGIALLAAGAIVSAEGDGKRKGKRHKKAKEEVVVVERNTTMVHVVWGAREVEVVRAHYAPRYRHLPPGLAKKYARTGQLPPGWQKKMEPLPHAVERSLPPLPRGYRRGVIDAHAVIYNGKGAIIDVAVLF